MSVEISDTELKRALQSIDPYPFEHFIRELWKRKGWETTVSDAANDQGVDVRATKDYPYEQKVLIQAKRYGPGTTVGGPDVQQYASLAHQEDGVDKVVIVTSNEFTPQARAMADSLNVKCLNENDLIDIVQQENAIDLLAEYANADLGQGQDQSGHGRSDKAVTAADHTSDGDDSGQSAGILTRLGIRENVENADWLHLTDGEEIQWTGRPSVFTIASDLVIAGVLFFSGFIVAGLLIAFFEGTPIPDSLGLLALLVSAAALASGIWTYAEWLRTLYVITDEEIYVKRGLISRDVTQVRLDRIQNTAYEQSIFERVLSLADVQVFTAGSAVEDLVFESVPNPEEVKRTLTTLLSDQRGSA